MSSSNPPSEINEADVLPRLTYSCVRYSSYTLTSESDHANTSKSYDIHNYSIGLFF